MTNPADYLPALARIADALDRLAPPPKAMPDLRAADGFVWHADGDRLVPVKRINRVDLSLLRGIRRQVGTLEDNTRRFARGLPANNALLWGARGMGKSSLVKAIHAKINEETGGNLALIELHREDIESLPRLLAIIAAQDRQVLLFCDDLSFDEGDTSYKSLKAVLDGGIEGRPANVLFYATSNRRHLLSREMIENETSTAIHASEAVEEKVSLSDRFGLWLGFHACDQDTYFDMIRGYVSAYDLKIEEEQLLKEAKEWAVTRGNRNGRVAFQYIQDLAGRLGQRID
ncbi:MAG: ATP-binding protein [Alphaproteobacteria bacterium]|nr:ATP-binding protein [Alphaproteobacteria bacterium]